MALFDKEKLNIFKKKDEQAGNQQNDKNKETKERFTKIDDTTYLDTRTGELITTYMSGRRARRIGRAFLRLGKVRMFLFCSIVVVAALFIISFMQEKAGNFTINLDRLELFRKGISISADKVFTNPTARLAADPIEDVTNISGQDLPGNINDVDGDHNGRNYMAYTYYLRNAGKEPVSYKAVITLDSATKGAEYASRVAVWKNDECTVYAMPASDGYPEAGCTNFISNNTICEYKEEDFQVGYVDKYTVVIWLEGDDPECVDAIVGGGLEFKMAITAEADDNTTLFEKFVQDIKDTLFSDRPINAFGTDSPDYAQDQTINWNTRLNK